jgi:hypothetical protein
MALTFTDAIAEVENPSVAPDDLVKYLREHAPQLAEAVLKDMTASDVHASTALGNQRRRKKPISTLGDPKPHKAQGEGEDSVDKTEWSTTFTVTKLEPEQQKIYGWASVVEENGQLIVDKQDDVIMPDDLQKAAEEFVLYSRAQGDMHERKGVGRLIMSFVTTQEMTKAFGMTVEHNRVGWIVGFKVDDDSVWKSIKAGNRPEFSIGGRGERIDV